MKIIKNKNTLKRLINGMTNISFIPTMGSLHEGHLSLIKKAKAKKGKVIVSIYINPKQFNSHKDFKDYPRNFKKDLKMLKRLKIDLLFIPSYKDIFSFQMQNNLYLHKSSKYLCGKHRPGHFLGVVNIVNRFLEIINPDFIYLGKKDYQQIFLIQNHINLAKIKTKVISCRTIRNKNGLPYSSRNKNLNETELFLAAKVIKLIKKEKSILKKKAGKKHNLFDLKKEIVKIGISKLEYLEKINLVSLKKEINPKKRFNIFIAFYINKVRLIDNV